MSTITVTIDRELVDRYRIARVKQRAIVAAMPEDEDTAPPEAHVAYRVATDELDIAASLIAMSVHNQIHGGF